MVQPGVSARGIEIEHNGLAAQVLERDFFSVLVLQSKVGSLIIDIHANFSGEIEVQRRDAQKSGQPSESSSRFYTARFHAAGSLVAALLAGVVSLPMAATAQEERPQITPGERKAPRKKEAGPRALAVLQLGANGKASLVPVAILVNGKFWDATAYKADPVPMALESGTVYEASRAGSSLGLFTVNSALHSNAANTQNPWLGTGNWVPTGSEVKSDIPKAESVPAGMDNADQPPRLTRNPSKEPPAAPRRSRPLMRHRRQRRLLPGMNRRV